MIQLLKEKRKQQQICETQFEAKDERQMEMFSIGTSAKTIHRWKRHRE